MGYRVCASDFAEYMEATLLRPFGMTASGYEWKAAMQRALATPHDAAGQPLTSTPPSLPAIGRYGSAGALMTTATDYARFLLEVMRPKPADDYRLNEASRNEMLRPQIEAGASPIKTSWALGWQIWHLDPGNVVAHGGRLRRLAFAVGVLAGAQDRVRHPDQRRRRHRADLDRPAEAARGRPGVRVALP